LKRAELQVKPAIALVGGEKTLARTGSRMPTPAGQTCALSTVALATVLVGTFLAVTDGFIVNVALPTIALDLRASSDMLQFVVTGYGLAYALLLVVGGRIGDAAGRRRAFMAGMGGFTAMSLACGIAPSISWLVLARVLQGAAAALMAPQVLATIQATTTGDRRARALGVHAATGALAAMAGQVVGGALVTLNLAGASWRPIFLVNVPIGLVGLLLARQHLPDTRSTEPAAIDPIGTLLLTATVASVLIPLIEGRAQDWPLWSIGLLIAAAILGFLFVVTERRIEHGGGFPLVPPSLLRVASMRRGLLIAALFFGGFGGFMFVYPLSLQGTAHLSALQAGTALGGMALGFLITSLTSARLLAYFGRRLIVAGLLVAIVGLLMLIAVLWRMWPALNPLLLVPSMLVAGIGSGMVVSPLFGIILAEVPIGRVGAGSGVLATTQQVAIAVGVSGLGGLFLTRQSATSLEAFQPLLLVLGAVIVIDCVAAVVSWPLGD
jgi:EmrB/QacA subfamily drug resistance transporter